jgi:hypothetical protein
MKIIANILFWLLYNLVAKRREPDQVIGDKTDPYLLRWWLFGAVTKEDGTRHPRRPLGRCVFLHCFVRSDDDRALHDHPWDYASFILRGSYIEHKDEGSANFDAGSLRFGQAETAHRIELFRASDAARIAFLRELDLLDRPWMPGAAFVSAYHNGNMPVWTLFSMGLWKRDWGFHCPQGWKHWREFTKGENGNEVGEGCGFVKLRAEDLRPERPATLRCYQCDRLVPWLAPDSRCTRCTRCTAEEIF